LTFFSIPILTQMYGTSNASKYIMLMAPCFLFLYIQGPLQATLFALDLAHDAMKNSLIGSIIKFSLLFILASNETFGIFGVVIAMNTTVILITLLHLNILYKKINFMLRFIDISKMFALIFVTGLFSYVCKRLFDPYLHNVFILLLV